MLLCLMPATIHLLRSVQFKIIYHPLPFSIYIFMPLNWLFREAQNKANSESYLVCSEKLGNP